MVIFHLLFINKKGVFEIQFPMLLFLCLFKTTRKWKVGTKNKMDSPRFVDDETIPLVQDEDYVDCNAKDTARIDVTFTEPGITEVKSTLKLRQKVKRDKLTALYRHLNVTGDTGLTDVDRFMIKKFQNRQHRLTFFDSKHWQSITNKRTGGFLAAKTLREKFGGLNVMKSVLNSDRSLEGSFNAAIKLGCELPTDIEMESIPLEELSPLVEYIHIKT